MLTLGSVLFRPPCSVMIVRTETAQRFVLAGKWLGWMKNVIQETMTITVQGKYMAGINALVFLLNVIVAFSFDHLPSKGTEFGRGENSKVTRNLKENFGIKNASAIHPFKFHCLIHELYCTNYHTTCNLWNMQFMELIPFFLLS